MVAKCESEKVSLCAQVDRPPGLIPDTLARDFSSNSLFANAVLYPLAGTTARCRAKIKSGFGFTARLFLVMMTVIGYNSRMNYAYHPDGALPTTAGSIFVFGSNEGGRHGAGAAKVAAQRFGALYGCGVGPVGSAYAIPTKDARLKVLSLAAVGYYVKGFLVFACAHPELQFFVTRVGCGLAGYRDEEVAPIFRGAPLNCIFPEPWRVWLEGAEVAT